MPLTQFGKHKFIYVWQIGSMHKMDILHILQHNSFILSFYQTKSEYLRLSHERSE